MTTKNVGLKEKHVLVIARFPAAVRGLFSMFAAKRNQATAKWGRNAHDRGPLGEGQPTPMGPQGSALHHRRPGGGMVWAMARGHLLGGTLECKSAPPLSGHAPPPPIV